MIITIDGPAGAGKSTVSREVAKRLGFVYMDTGAMYRACGLAALENNVPLDDSKRVEELLNTLEIRLEGDKILLNGRDVTKRIREPDIDAAASKISQLPVVRDFLSRLQKQMAQDGDVVAEGRDMGTVVFPEADLKIFLTASPEERARRRQRQLEQQGDIISYEIILQQIKKRDKADSTRQIAPLRAAPDAIVVDSTGLSAHQVVEKILQLV